MNKNIIAVIGAIILFGGIYWMNSGETLDVKKNPIVDQFTNNVDQQVPADQQTVPSAATGQTSPIGTAGAEVVTDTKIDTKKIMKATLKTTMGDIAILLSPEVTPNTVENFVKLAQSGYYNGTKFHRVIRGFMNQGGDPLSKDDSMMQRWGTGGPGYTFADEIGPSNKNAVGTISMANAGPNTNGSQFFINAADNFSLDGKHTVFGAVVAGADVVQAINATPTDGADRPLTPVVIESIVLE